MSATLWCTYSVLAKAGSTKRANAPKKDCRLEFQFPMGFKYYQFGNKKNLREPQNQTKKQPPSGYCFYCAETYFLATSDTLYTSALMVI